MSSPVLFDTVTDSDGDAVEVLAMGRLVILRVIERGSGNVQEVFLDAGLRDRFIKAYVAAEASCEDFIRRGQAEAGPAT